jgi:branched-chain amino acid transport system substrate-binding protein
MSFERRQLLKSAGLTLGGAMLAPLAAPLVARHALGADPIKVGSLLDLGGPIGVSGEPMYAATELAVAEINAAGGLLGRPLQLINYDTQSSMQLYSQYAQQLCLRDKVAVVHGGITSASREAVRPVFDRFHTLYFYNTQYEGGVCDRNIFCTGTTPGQTVDKLVPYALKNWGKKVYIVAADYNYGQITAKWMTKFTKEGGGSVVATDFFPLDVSDFSAAISKIQQLKPDMVFSALVGSNHLGFYRQWAASGMKNKIPVGSTVFGLANELATMTPQETDGIVTAYGFYPDLPTEKAKAFTSALRDKYHTYACELASASYEGVFLWASAVKKAKSIDRMKVIQALETGITIEGPSGKVTMDPATHHTTRNAYLAKAENRTWDILQTFPDQTPSDTAAVCNLLKNPNTNKQFVVDIKT